MRLLAPRQNKSQSYLFRLPSTSTGLGHGRCWKINPGKSTAVRRSAFLPHSTDICWLHIHTHTHILITNYYTYTHIPPHPRSLASVALNRQPDKRVWTSANLGCRTGWLIARAGLLPLLQSRVSMVYCVLLLLRCFSCSHTVLPKEHSLGVIFFFLLTFLMLCYAVFFFNSLSSCPVYPLVIYVVYVWTGWWLISLVLVTSDNKGLLLLLLLSPARRALQ